MIILKILFWVSLLGSVIRVSRISSSNYPRIETYTLGSDVAILIIDLILMYFIAVALEWV